MKCEECVELLERFTDRELSEREVAVVKHHLDACPPCEHRFRLQADIGRLVRTRCSEGSAPAHLRAKLREIMF